MGKIIEFPCRDYYEEYEDYYGEEFEEQGYDYGNYGEEVLVKENWVRGFVRKCLMFLLIRL